MYLMAAQGNNYCKINLKKAEASPFQSMILNTKSFFSVGRENSRILQDCEKQTFSLKVLLETK